MSFWLAYFKKFKHVPSQEDTKSREQTSKQTNENHSRILVELFFFHPNLAGKQQQTKELVLFKM